MPLSRTASFTAYAGNTFKEEDQRDLAACAKRAWQQGIPVIISNHDTAATQTLYTPARLERFSVQRYISCDGSGRKTAPELLAVYR